MKFPIRESRQCPQCKRWQHGTRLCAAFPDYPGIPKAILWDEFDHRQPFAGDQGIRWEPREPGIQHPFDQKSTDA